MSDDRLIIEAELLDHVSGPARRAEVATDRLAASARRAGQAAGGAGTSGVLQMATAGDRLAKIASQTDSTLSRLSNTAADKVGRAMKVMALAVGVASVALTGLGIKTAASLEMGRVNLEAITGSAEEAKSIFAFLQKLDPVVPFDIGQLQMATTMLAGAGYQGEALRKVLVGVTDVASTSFDPQEGIRRVGLVVAQMHSAGVVMQQDLNQLAQAGVNVGPALEKAAGMSLAEFRKRGPGAGADSDAFLEALFGMRAGNAEKVATTTLTGLLSGVRSRVMLALGREGSPLLEQLKSSLPAIEAGVGGVIDTLFPPLVRIGGLLISLLLKALPLATPILSAIAGGLERLINAGAPALAALEPLAGQVGKGLGDMFTTLAPVMPDVVTLLVSLVGLLPDMIRLLTGLVLLADPFVKLLNVLLGFGPTRAIFAGLLVALLGYSKLSSLFKTMRTFAEMLQLIAVKQTAVNVANAGSGGVGGLGMAGGGAAGKLGAGLGILAGAGLALNGQTEKPGLSSDLKSVAGLGLAGAGIGSLLPGVGTLIGGGVGLLAGGLLAGAHHLDAGDTARPFSGSVPGVLAAADAATGGSRHVTSGYRAWGLGGLGSDHLTGRALDLVGANLNAYKQSVERMGGYAEFHGAGNDRHLHAVGDTPRPMPSTSALGSGGGVHVTFAGDIIVKAEVDLERAVRAGIAKAEMDARERGKR